MLGLCCCVRPPPFAAHTLLSAAASLWSTGSAEVAHELSCSAACGACPGQGSNPSMVQRMNKRGYSYSEHSTAVKWITDANSIMGYQTGICGCRMCELCRRCVSTYGHVHIWVCMCAHMLSTHCTCISRCMCAYVGVLYILYTHMCVYMSAHIYVHTCAYLCTHVHVSCVPECTCMYECVHVCMHMCVHAWTDVCALHYVHMSTNGHVCQLKGLYVCVPVHSCIHTCAFTCACCMCSVHVCACIHT